MASEAQFVTWSDSPYVRIEVGTDASPSTLREAGEALLVEADRREADRQQEGDG